MPSATKVSHAASSGAEGVRMREGFVTLLIVCGIAVTALFGYQLIRSVLTEFINRRPDMMVVGAAPDPIVARDMIRNLNHDVLTLDVEMLRKPAAPSTSKSTPVLALGTRAGTEKLIVVGASTGGTKAIKDVLLPMPPDAPGIVITQHMSAGFTRSFAQCLDGLCKISVKEAVDGERILPGHAHIALGDHHLLVRKSGANYVTALSHDEPVNRHRPSVEVLFRSAAQCVGANAIGVMLTGMGKDGATAMMEMKRAGAFNVAQDEASCVVFGMPKEAIAAGGVDEVLPLGNIAERVLGLLRAGGVRHRI